MMKRYIFIISVLFMFMAACVSSRAQTRKDRLTGHVYFFASDSLKGRSAGSEDAAKAADYIAEQFRQIGLTPFFDDWFQYFTKDNYNNRNFHNVVGKIEGSDPVLKNEYIIIGAHYDHLGVKKGEIYNGADDNASGSAALIEIARELSKDPQSLKRTVVFAAFDGEELGLLGSYALSEAIDIKKVKLMMSVDMVGWLVTSGELKLEGTATIKNGKAILSENAVKTGLVVKSVNFEKSIMTATDTQGFAEKGVPTLAISTGLKSPYHKPQDDADLIDYDGLDKVTEYLTDINREFASNGQLRPSGRLSFKHRPQHTLEFGISAGAGSANHHYTSAAFDGKSSSSWNAGALVQINAGKTLSLQVNPSYENLSCLYPDESNLWGNSLKWKQESILVPVDLLAHSSGTSYGYIGIGGYYNYLLSGSLSEGTLPGDINNQWGAEWCLGSRVYYLDLKVSFRYQINKVFTSDPQMKTRESIFSAIYHF